MTYCFLVALLTVQIFGEQREIRDVKEENASSLTELVSNFMDNDIIRDEVVERVIQKLTEANHFRIRAARNDGISYSAPKRSSYRNPSSYCSQTKGHGCTSGWKRLSQRR